MILGTRPASVHAFIAFPNIWVAFSQYTFVFLVFGTDSRHAPRGRSRIYCFSVCLGNMFVVNLCIPCVWQWFSRCAPLSSTYLYVSYRLANIVPVNLWIPCVWQWFSLCAKRALIYVLFSFGLDNMFWVNIWIPFVWQWISQRAQRAFIHLLRFWWFA